MSSVLRIAFRNAAVGEPPLSGGRRSRRITSLIGLALLTCLLLPHTTRASILGVATTPSTRPLAVGQPTTVSIVWNVVRGEGGNDNCGNTVSSTSVVIRVTDPPGDVVLTIPRTLSQTRACPPPLTGTSSQFVFTESLFIPADVIQRAQKLGAPELIVERTFSDSSLSIPVAATVTLPITGSAAAGFNISREALQFDNGAPVRVLGRREVLQAFAEIDYTGSGLLQGVWELAGPTSTTGEPIFRPLSQVRVFVAPTGDKKVLKSPPLPTDAIGLYLVRLRITDPAPSFEAPVIRYFVGDGRPGRELPPQPLSAYSPPPSAVLARDTKFTWAPIPGAKAYQVQIYRLAREGAVALPSLDDGEAADPREIARALSRPPVTGMLVAAKQTSTPLSSAARMHLVPGGAYLWRVQAIGADGAVIAESLPRELRAP